MTKLLSHRVLANQLAGSGCSAVVSNIVIEQSIQVMCSDGWSVTMLSAGSLLEVQEHGGHEGILYEAVDEVVQRQPALIPFCCPEPRSRICLLVQCA